MTTLASLPQDIHLLILAHLSAPDLLCLQLTSHTHRAVFTDPIYLRTLIRTHPHSRESRLLFSAPSPLTPNSSSLLSLFTTLATRYHHLTHARPHSLTQLPLRALDQSGHWYPPPQWDYHESQPGGRLYHESAAVHLRISSTGWKPYLFRPTLWSYDDGMVVFAPAVTGHRAEEMRDGYLFGGPRGESKGEEEDWCLRVVDLESEDHKEGEAVVPFDVREKIVREIRLKDGVLVVEWAEKEPFHDLNMVDRVHRHFATVFDVRRVHEMDTDTAGSTNETTSSTVSVTFRSEFKIHFLGFPLTSRDYFFTVHNSRHYALYYWQPNRSLWTGDEDQPIESLAVWDISRPSSYRPSKDPSGACRPDPKLAGPRIVAKFPWRQLDWLGARQGGTISLMGLEIDSEAQTVTMKENAFVSGQGYFDPAERNWCSTYTTFLFVGEGPVLQRRGEIELPPYRGHSSMESAGVEDVEKWFLPILDVVDAQAKVRFALIETCFTGLGLQNRIMLRVKVGTEGEWINMEDDVVRELGAMGRIAGDERWVIGQNSKLQLVIARFQ